MSKTITISENKNLKLTNVVIREINFEEDIELNTVVLQMENYIKAKGAVPLGPLVQKTVYSIDDTGQLDIHMYIMRQANNFIKKVQNGVWLVNPNILMKGNDTKRQILLSYYESEEPINQITMTRTKRTPIENQKQQPQQKALEVNENAV